MFSSNTGSTDFRDTEVQQPNTTSTCSDSSSSRARSAKSGQSDAGSTTTASTGRPSSPPCAFCSSTIIRMVSLSVVSLMAMVPDSEWRTPTLMGSPAAPDSASSPDPPQAARTAVRPATRNACFSLMVWLLWMFGFAASVRMTGSLYLCG